jgi:hypothetical protein
VERLHIEPCPDVLLSNIAQSKRALHEEFARLRKTSRLKSVSVAAILRQVCTRCGPNTSCPSCRQFSWKVSNIDQQLAVPCGMVVSFAARFFDCYR